MNTAWPRSLLWRLGLALVVLQILVTAGLWLFIAGQSRAHHEGQTLDTLSRLTGAVAAALADDIEAADPRALEDLTQQIGANAGARFTVVREDGIVLADSDADPATMDNHRWRPEIDDAFETGAGSSSRFSRTVDRNMLYFARRVENERLGPLVIRGAMPRVEVAGGFEPLARATALGGVAFLLIAIVLVLLISRRFARRIDVLAQAASRFADGDLAHRLPPQRENELAKLASNLNAMAEQLEARLAQVQDQETELRAILQSMSSGVIALDLDQRILHMNVAAARLLEVELARAPGRLLHSVVRQPDLHQIVSRALAGRSQRTVEFSIASQPPRRIQASCETLVDAENRVRGLLLILNDVTELRRLEQMRTDFAANVSHELRTPITNIKGFVETLMEVGHEDREQSARFLSVIKQNTDRLSAIIDDVLALTRLEEPRTTAALEREETPAERIIRPVVAQYQPAAAAKSIQLAVDIDRDLVISVHPDLMQQALGNLLSNAINYSPASTTVTISGRSRDGSAVISVRDEGPGIPAQHLPRLFERFYRVDKGRSRQVGGTGLGLAIVKHIMRVHAGTVEVSSKVGRGSEFRLVVPGNTQNKTTE